MDIFSHAELTVDGHGKAGPSVGMNQRRGTHYKVECHGPDGQLKWVDEFDNMVVTAGLNDALDKHFKAAAYTAAWYVGLTDGTPTFALGDTMDGGHAGWVEVTAYDEVVRQTLTLGAIAAGSCDNSAAPAVFTISAAATVIGGAFIVTTSNKGGATGTLYGGGAFSGGDRTLGDNDTLTVTVTLTAAN